MHRWPMWLGLLLGLAAVATGFEMGADRVEQWGMAARFTARVGFPLLILAYVARPLTQLVKAKWAKSLLAKRQWIGLGFAMSHTVHLVALFIALEVANDTRPWFVYLIGGGAYAMLYVMAFTSNQYAMRSLGKWWKRLHRFGIHYLWLIFAQSYVGRIFQDGKMEEGAIGAGIAFAAAAIRFAAWRRSRARKAASAT